MTLGKNIQNLRKQKHMTQEELAQLLNVTRQAISKWESNYNEPDIKTLKKLACIFEITVDELIFDHEEIIEENIVEDKNELTKEILKTNKKSHRLLIVLISIIICSLVVFIICPLATQSNPTTYYTPKEEPIERISNIQQQITKEISNSFISNLHFEVKITSFKNQKMNFKAYIETYKPHEEGIMTLLYQDGTKEELDIYSTIGNELSYICEKEIDAKDIKSITIQMEEQETTFDAIAFPIENYMYGIAFSPELKATSNQSFEIKFSMLNCRDKTNYIEEFFDEKFFIENYAEDSTTPIQSALPIKMVLKKNDQVIKEWLIEDEKQLEEAVVIDEKFNNNASYSLALSYQTPLNKTLEDVLGLDKSHFESY